MALGITTAAAVRPAITSGPTHRESYARTHSGTAVSHPRGASDGMPSEGADQVQHRPAEAVVHTASEPGLGRVKLVIHVAVGKPRAEVACEPVVHTEAQVLE